MGGKLSNPVRPAINFFTGRKRAYAVSSCPGSPPAKIQKTYEVQDDDDCLIIGEKEAAPPVEQSTEVGEEGAPVQMLLKEIKTEVMEEEEEIEVEEVIEQQIIVAEESTEQGKETITVQEIVEVVRVENGEAEQIVQIDQVVIEEVVETTGEGAQVEVETPDAADTPFPSPVPVAEGIQNDIADNIQEADFSQNEEPEINMGGINVEAAPVIAASAAGVVV